MHVRSSCFAHKTNCFLTLLLLSSSSLLKVPNWTVANSLKYIDVNWTGFHLLKAPRSAFDIPTSPLRIIWKNLIEERSLFPLLIIFLIFITFSIDYILISLGQNRCWSVLGLHGVILVSNMRLVNTRLSSVAILLYSTVFCGAFLLVMSSCTW